MTADIFGLAQVVVGKALEGTYLARPDLLPEPFSKVYRMILDGKTKEEIIASGVISALDLNNCVVAATVKYQPDIDYTKLAYELNWKNSTLKTIERFQKRLERGEPITDLLPSVEVAVRKYGEWETAIRRIDEVEISDLMMPSGWKLFDSNTGVPSEGMLLVNGRAGVGKSWFTMKLMLHLLNTYTDETGLVLSLELGEGQWRQRAETMYPSLFENTKERLFISSSIRNIDQLEDATANKHFRFILIDYADFFVKQITPADFQEMYMGIVSYVRRKGHDGNPVLVIMVSQPNRMNNTSKRFLDIHSTSWSGGSENSADMMISLQKLSGTSTIDWDDKRYPLPQTFGDTYYYVLVNKMRHKPLKNTVTTTGAIVLKYNAKLPMWDWTPIDGEDNYLLYAPSSDYSVE